MNYEKIVRSVAKIRIMRAHALKTQIIRIIPKTQIILLTTNH